MLGVGGEVEGLSGFVSIPLNFCGYSAAVGSITDRIREIRLAGKPAQLGMLTYRVFIGGNVYAVDFVVRDVAQNPLNLS